MTDKAVMRNRRPIETVISFVSHEDKVDSDQPILQSPRMAGMKGRRAQGQLVVKVGLGPIMS